jgi:hypothetical protein
MLAAGHDRDGGDGDRRVAGEERGGGWLGFMLTAGIPCLTPIGVIAGIILGLSLARPTNRLLRRSGRPPRPRVYPSYRRYGP